jgi:hypothetical protein
MLVAGLVLAGCAGAKPAAGNEVRAATIGLFTTLPILDHWG